MSSEVKEQPQPKTLTVPAMGPGGESKGELSISTDKIDGERRYRLIKEAVVNFSANQRQGTHKTKTRAQVKGAGKKPWRQKGTGHARSGSRKSPIWRGGGTVFGPQPRDYSYSINKKQRRLALLSAVYMKLEAGDALVLDGFSTSEPRTRHLAKALGALGLEGQRVLIGSEDLDRNLYLSARNLPKVEVLPIQDFNTYSVLSADTVVLTRGAFDRMAAGGCFGAREAGAQETGGDS